MSTSDTKCVGQTHENDGPAVPKETHSEDNSKQTAGDECPQSPDISLSLENTLRYSDVEGETKDNNNSSSSSSSSSDDDDDSDSSEESSSDSVKDKFKDAAEMHEQSQFKNSFYEKLSVTCQNLESTVASLQKPMKIEESTEPNSAEEISSQTVPESLHDSNVIRPETLSLSQRCSAVADKHKKEVEKPTHIPFQQNLLIDIDSDPETKKDNQPQGAYYIEPSSSLSPNLLQGTVVRKGERIEFVADNLVEKIKQSTSPLSHADSTGSHGSRRSSVRSIVSASSSTSFATSSGMSRSPSSLLQQSPDDIPPIDAGAVLELENHAKRVADSLDLMMGNIRNNLHKMSAITIGCQDAYKRSVDITCDSVDGSIKTMYALMAKCEELSMSMKPVDQLAAQIKEIKRILDLFESQLSEKS